MLDIFYHFFGANTELFYIINKELQSWFTPQFMRFISSLFSIFSFALYYSIYTIYCYYNLRKTSDYNLQHQNFWKKYYALVKTGILYTLFGTIYAILKFTINLPRPFCSLPPQSFTTIIDTKLERCLSSFPSAHTGLALMITYILWPHLKTYLKIFAIITICLTAISRITLAMHYPADIIYSLIITTMIILLSNFIFNIIKRKIAKNTGEFLYKTLYQKNKKVK